MKSTPLLCTENIKKNVKLKIFFRERYDYLKNYIGLKYHSINTLKEEVWSCFPCVCQLWTDVAYVRVFRDHLCYVYGYKTS